MPYQPVVEALRPYVAACPPSTLRESLHGLESDLVRAFPELVGRLPELSVPAASNPVIVGLADREAQRQTERYRLFEVFATLLTGIAAAQPAVLVLDDVHWADNATLLLFRHLLRTTQGAALFVVGCYRDVEVARAAKRSPTCLPTFAASSPSPGWSYAASRKLPPPTSSSASPDTKWLRHW